MESFAFDSRLCDLRRTLDQIKCLRSLAQWGRRLSRMKRILPDCWAGPFKLLLHLRFLQCVLDAWAQQIGLMEIRQDPQHSFAGEATIEPSDAGVAALAMPLSLIFAHFGTAVPLGSKIKARSTHTAGNEAPPKRTHQFRLPLSTSRSCTACTARRRRLRRCKAGRSTKGPFSEATLPT